MVTHSTVTVAAKVLLLSLVLVLEIVLEIITATVMVKIRAMIPVSYL